MTPMVDIGFLLVIFFMCTTVFREPQAMEITLPPSKAEVKTAQSNVLTLRLLKDAKILWNVSDQAPQEVGLKQLSKLLRDQRKANISKNYPGGEAQAVVARWESSPQDTSLMRQMEDWSKLVVLVKVHRDCRYEVVVDVMDDIQHEAMSRFSLVELTPEDLESVQKGVKK
jgi:biopolymer transport protein ExbD